MPISVPTPDDVHGFFKQLVSAATRCTREIDQNEFNNLEGLAGGWQRITRDPEKWWYGIWRLTIDQSTSLIRVSMEIHIDRHKDDPLRREIKRQIESFLRPLPAFVPPQASAGLVFTFEDLSEEGPSIHVPCKAEGIVVSATSLENQDPQRSE